MSLRPESERRVKRWAEQRWAIDNMISVQRASLGAQAPVSTSPRLYTRTVGGDGAQDLASVSLRVDKFDDISREFARIALRRENQAKKAEAEEHFVTARENYALASYYWADAAWPIFEDDNPQLKEFFERKNACFDKVIQYAPHPIERVEIPYGDQWLPCLLHLPPQRPAKVPCLASLDGMDSFKEMMHGLYDDKFLTRGIAVLAVDGPGQGECNLRKIRVEADSFARVGKACFEYLLSREEIDHDNIIVKGRSFGSYWVTQAAAAEPRFKSASGTLGCLEPGMDTIFNKAVPAYKMRFMWMAGYDSEEAFDKFAKSLTWEPWAPKVTQPFLAIVGQNDELSPVQYAYDLYDALTCPKTLIVYEGGKHNMIGQIGLSAEDNQTIEADWMRDRIDGKPLTSERIMIKTSGEWETH